MYYNANEHALIFNIYISGESINQDITLNKEDLDNNNDSNRQY